jgi:hypothetical protein
MMLGKAIARIHDEELDLADTFRVVADAHAAEIDLAHLCRRFADQCQHRAEGLRPFAQKYGAHLGGVLSRRFRSEVVGGARHIVGKLLHRTELSGAELLLDLRRLFAMAHRSKMDWVLLREAGHAAHNHALRAYAEAAQPEKDVQIRWLETRLRQSAVQVIVFS